MIYTLHQVGGETGDFVSHSLGRDESNFFGDFLVDLEVQSQFGVVLLNNDARGALDSSGSDTTHFVP